MSNYKNFVRLSPEYEDEYVRRYGRQPKYIPFDFVTNFGIPPMIKTHGDFSRVWSSNPKFKQKKKND